jgi:hypothetical protein
VIRVRVAVIVACALLPLGAPAHATAAPRCEAMAFSPRFAADGTMFCATRADGDVYGFSLLRSTDRGRTWQHRSTTYPEDTGEQIDLALQAMYVEPAFPSPRTVYVQLSVGLFQAQDDGADVLRLTSNPLGYPWNVTQFREGVPGGPQWTSFANARGNVTYGSVVYDTALSSRQRIDGSPHGRDVVGPPSVASHFFVAPDYVTSHKAVAIGHRQGVSTYEGKTVGILEMQAFRCTGDFACLEPVADFGARVMGMAGSLGGLDWMTMFSAPFPGMPPVDGPHFAVVQSRDGGLTWQHWTSVERLALTREVLARKIPPHVEVSRSPDAPRRLFMRIHYPPGTADWLGPTPVERVFRSDDDGATWRLLAYARSPEQRGPRGTLPYNGWGPVGQAGALGWFSAQPGGRLYTLAATQTGGAYPNSARFSYVGPYCSPDSGVTWRRGTAC